MFRINGWIEIDIGGIIALALLVLAGVWFAFKAAKKWFQVRRMKTTHKNIERRHDSAYWNKFVCKDCGKLLYTSPTSVNGALPEGKIYLKEGAFEKCKENQ